MQLLPRASGTAEATGGTLHTAARQPDWRLRALLSLLLVALVLVASVVTMTRADPTPMVAVAPVVPHSLGPATPVSLAAASAPGPSAGPEQADSPPPAAAASGCGLSTAAQPPPSPVGHCTVVEIGDSLGSDLAWGLARQVAPASGLRLVQLDKPDTGLSNPWFYDWPAHLATALAQYRPQLVVVCLGGNDEQGMEVDGSAVPFGTPAWRSAYLARVRQLIGEATAGGAYVLWIGMPVMQQPSYSAGMQTLNGLYQQAVDSEPGATFVSTWSLFGDPAGGFRSDALVNGRPASLRQPDGIHYSLAGEDVVATYVIRQLGALYHVSLEPLAPAVITAWG